MAVQDEQTLALAGKGFADATRIAAGDGVLWRDIFIDNADELRAGIGQAARATRSSRIPPSPRTAALLKEWLDRDGRQTAIDAIKNIVDAMTNIEVKARYPDLENARAICRRIAASYQGILNQTDTYFRVAIRPAKASPD